MIFANEPPQPDALRAAICDAYLSDEAAAIEALLPVAAVSPDANKRIAQRARGLVTAARKRAKSRDGIDAFLNEYDLSSTEGVMLMCLAEALLRIPDADTADKLIQDKLARGQWDAHLGHSQSLFVNASTWGLMLTGRIVALEKPGAEGITDLLRKLTARLGEPVIRVALNHAMRIMGHEFVMGRTIGEALKRSQMPENQPYRYSFDMLGEAALCAKDAERYYDSYAHAIDALAKQAGNSDEIFSAPGISIKLSALHPRFEFAKRDCVLKELTPRVQALAERARDAGIGITLDMEEANRLELTLDVFENVYNKLPSGWNGFGLALQAYQKRAIHVVDWLINIARKHQRRIPLRLVKGAYWDSEIKLAQQEGLDGYAVFTRKPSTDVSYLACAKRIWSARDVLFPQFATHNAHTVAFLMEMARDDRNFEFQRLHGMGEALYAEIVDPETVACRVYAPVGSHEDLLPYLVRRLLENGANTSFVNRLNDETLSVESIIADPVQTVRATKPLAHPRIPLSSHLFGDERRNSHGIDWADSMALTTLARDMESHLNASPTAQPVVDGERLRGQSEEIKSPSDRRCVVGHVEEAGDAAIEAALNAAAAASGTWSRTDIETRARHLERAADMLEQNRAELMVLCIREGGKTVRDSLNEVREATDFCRYYAATARRTLAERCLRGPTGESNKLGLHGRGAFVCISPWNFPLAIFTGQIAAAMVTGNTVIAKPAERTPLVAARTVHFLHDAGIPHEVLQFLPGRGDTVGARLVSDERIAGVAFTGSTETARSINKSLASRAGPIIPLIAETGGQNAMIVDSSALAEQVVKDVLTSAFGSAGQRCSALRVLFLQEDVAERIIGLLKGAMAELTVGDPRLLSTDIGPVIDEQARQMLETHSARMQNGGIPIYQTRLATGTRHGTFFAPRAYQIDSLARLGREVFGPVLHVIRYAADSLDDVIEAINNTGYGLTLGIHSRIDTTARYIQDRVRVGNIYVNRNMVGATVGVQPFGGEGLSGTGPKAGGPNYLQRFSTERSISVNTAAAGGNANLFQIDGAD
ncbi:MAG: bifunctional proline dehydrogenase/L-glutamate gamma-semialdehyde dehydrogenase PutA [Burkholderiales bacterium]|jgi:RHH-type proline utilization regulon transcriptional repressor/proline dehydrogenase/delta 1-pyrroline-5-carboxylate dehydrogenase